MKSCLSMKDMAQVTMTDDNENSDSESFEDDLELAANALNSSKLPFHDVDDDAIA